MDTKPTFLFVHGAWYAPSFWDGMAARLAARGFPTATVALAACGNEPTSDFGDLYDDPVAAFLNDCTADVASDAVAAMTYFSAKATTQRVRHAGWRTRPAAYIAGTKDTHLSLQAQEQMGSLLTRTYTMETDHSPFLSHPDELAELLTTAAPDLGAVP